MNALEIANKYIGSEPNHKNPTWAELKSEMVKDIEDYAKPKLSESDIHLIGQALNSHWNDASYHLTEIKHLGDIEREMYQSQLIRSEELMRKLGIL